MLKYLQLKTLCSALITVWLIAANGCCFSVAQAEDGPAPIIEKGALPVDWWFVFKFNTKSFPSCARPAKRHCIFGGDIQDYPRGFGQQFISSSSKDIPFVQGKTCLGDTTKDPVGATFEQVYNGNFFFVIWNDQFYADPDLPACRRHGFCEQPWAHSKGMLAWGEDGDGFVMQVTTPNWPGAGSKRSPRQQNGNTLGCLTADGENPHNNVLVSQHFFSVKLKKEDVIAVLKAMRNAGIVTEHNKDADDRDQVVKNGGPAEIAAEVDKLGTLPEPASSTFLKQKLSNGVQIISKPARIPVPPWQAVSAMLDKAPLNVATWYSANKIPDTDGTEVPECWHDSLGKPGAVKNIETGHWLNKSFGLTGGSSPDRNHAKIGVSVSGDLSIFGDMNQEGALTEKCKVRQNPRGGLFYVVENPTLAKQMRTLLSPVASRAVRSTRKTR